MRGHLWPLGREDETVTRIAVDDTVGVYRPEGSYKVVAEAGGERLSLGVEDVTVSRNDGTRPPVELEPGPDGIAVVNNANKNDVVVHRHHGKSTVEQGQRELVDENCKLQIGYNTKLRLTVSSEEVEAGRSDDETIVDGVHPARYAQQLAESLRQKRSESPQECLKKLDDVTSFVEEYEVEATSYGEVREDVQATHDRLERYLDNVSRDADSFRDDKEWQDRIDRIAHRVESLYADAYPT